jgi:uncharacterized protein (TIGR03084 family)
VTILDDLVAEQDRLEDILSGLSERDWLAPSAAAGWSVADVVLHLAQSEEAVSAAVTGASLRPCGTRVTVDQFMAQLVAQERAEPAAIFQRWRQARRAAVAALRSADPARPLSWVEAPLKPATLATTRLAEHWAHGLDITGPLGIALPGTDRLRHVAWLAHRTLPYALALAGGAPDTVFCELTAPDGVSTWQFGPADAGSAIRGPAGDFCRVAAQRLAPAESALTTTGPRGAEALAVLRTYAA